MERKCAGRRMRVYLELVSLRTCEREDRGLEDDDKESRGHVFTVVGIPLVLLMSVTLGINSRR